MADYGFADSFRLIFRSPRISQEVQCFDCAVVLKGHVGAMCVFGSGAKIVEKACQVVRLKKG